MQPLLTLAAQEPILMEVRICISLICFHSEYLSAKRFTDDMMMESPQSALPPFGFNKTSSDSG